MSRVSYAMLEAGYIPGDLGAFKKEGGKIKLYDSPSSSSPTSQTVTNLTYPEWAQADVKGIVGNALTLAKTGYQPYKNAETGLPIERIAKFDPLQLTAQQAVSNIGPSQQLGPATQYATSAGLKAGAVQYDPMLAQTGSFTQPGVAGQYMSPYTQNVIDIQNREAARQSEIQRNQNQAQAVGQGAFGGSRSAIVEAERQRNLQQMQGDIQQKGVSKQLTSKHRIYMATNNSVRCKRSNKQNSLVSMARVLVCRVYLRNCRQQDSLGSLVVNSSNNNQTLLTR